MITKNTQSFVPTVLVGYNSVVIDEEDLEMKEDLRMEYDGLRQGNLYVCMHDNKPSKVGLL